MRRRWLALCLLSVSLASGCGAGSAVPPLDAPPGPGPHGGRMIRLPDGHGFVEYQIEPHPKAKAGAKSAAGAAVIVVYFLGPDGQTALNPPPAEVRLAWKTPERTTVTVPLALQADSNAPAGASRFVSEPGPYGTEPLRGRLTATWEGRTFAVPVVTR
jgi:hypothetical protein